MAPGLYRFPLGMYLGDEQLQLQLCGGRGFVPTCGVQG